MRRFTWAARPAAVLVAAGLATILAAVPAAEAAIELAEEFPEVHQPVEVTVTTAEGAAASGVPVTARYGPGSQLIRDVPVGRTDPLGKISWTPEEPGIVALSAELPGEDGPTTISQNISVTFPGPPGSGVLVMMVAGFILYGGVVHGFTRLSRMVPELPPDT